MQVKRIAGALGAEILGVDLSKGLSDKLAREIRLVLLDRQAIFLFAKRIFEHNFLFN